MPGIDIPISVDLKELLELPPCDDLKLPSPSPPRSRCQRADQLTRSRIFQKGFPLTAR